MKVRLNPNYVINIIDEDTIEILENSYTTLMRIIDEDKSHLLAKLFKLLYENSFGIDVKILQEKLSLDNKIMEIIDTFSKLNIIQIIDETESSNVGRYFIDDESLGKTIEHLYSLFFKDKLIHVQDLGNAEIIIFSGDIYDYNHIEKVLKNNKKLLRGKIVYYYLYDGANINIISSIFGITGCISDFINFLNLNLGRELKFASNLLIIKKNKRVLSSNDLIALSFLISDIHSLINYKYPRLVGKIIQINDISISQIRLIRNPYCEICGVSPSLYGLTGDEY
ncbi:hypothetical protein EWF20_06685 [Sulfolobus sp. S-194]|uniref:hypothetical protein n=1 Tax=Sulfolobus sp. S-194 TaxID=2512240 RepID=UPI001436DC46|nr:hypothetical protein [Sulfolobus sp. S-194]QIW23867.1 hypothetical protein EWF20_06685 [Sulfolobus sp. S-194]